MTGSRRTPDRDSEGRIRVLFAVADMGGGGAERAVSNYLKELDRARFEPGLCLWRPVYRYGVPPDVPVWIMRKWSVWQLPGASLRTAGLLRGWRPDVVFSHLRYVNLSVGVALLLSGLRCGWIPCIQNNPENRDALLNTRLLVPFLRRANRICTVSRGIGERIVERFNIPGDRLRTLYNPMDLGEVDRALAGGSREEFSIPTVVTMGRLAEQKDHRTLLEAVARVREQRRLRLVILGEGALRVELQELARELGIERDVEFRGFLQNPFPTLAAADVFVLSSRWEGFGNALVEAMATGTACISTRCPFGPGEIIDHDRTGLLVPVGDAPAMAEAIDRLLGDDPLRRRLAEAGRADVRRRFSVERQTRILEGLLEESTGAP